MNPHPCDHCHQDCTVGATLCVYCKKTICLDCHGGILGDGCCLHSLLRYFLNSFKCATIKIYWIIYRECVYIPVHDKSRFLWFAKGWWLGRIPPNRRGGGGAGHILDLVNTQ